MTFHTHSVQRTSTSNTLSLLFIHGGRWGGGRVGYAEGFGGTVQDAVSLTFCHLKSRRRLSGGSTRYIQQLMGGYVREYGKLMDGPEEGNKGLDNLAAAARVLSIGQRQGTKFMEAVFEWIPSVNVCSMLWIPDDAHQQRQSKPCVLFSFLQISVTGSLVPHRSPC